MNRPSFRLPLAALLVLAFSYQSLHASTELITNGNFGSSTTAWTLDLIKGSKGSLTVDIDPDTKTSAHITVTEAAAVPYYVQLFQNQLNIKASQAYHLTFRAKAKTEGQISVNLMIAETPWTNLWKQDIKLTTDWQTFSYDITPSQATSNGRITFSQLGARADEYWFTDVSLTY